MIKIGGLLESLLQLKYISRNYDSANKTEFEIKCITFIEVDVTKCNLCGECEKICVTNSMKINNEALEIDKSCILCGLCILVCPRNAIAMKEIHKQGRKDERFV
ncbi:MAG: hypothetical protein COX48_00065 [bacterium (Candidatus Stahlbacteria) CG23_combo_of_CG06-09_8_20_14_all_34_7]|nr:MAG: hypothetical protein COX48_00065 [bacterium (Candidatus Stahlbacteria) CG23_combo_of_CG06-09_8_20_14_all_34_7]